MTTEVKERLGLAERNVDPLFVDVRHAQIEDAGHGQGAGAHLLVGGAADHRQAVADLDGHGIRQALADENLVGIGRGEIAAGHDVLGGQVDRLLQLGLDAADSNREGALAGGDKPAGVDAARGGQHLRLSEQGGDNFVVIGQWQQRRLVDHC